MISLRKRIKFLIVLIWIETSNQKNFRNISTMKKSNLLDITNKFKWIHSILYIRKIMHRTRNHRIIFHGDRKSVSLLKCLTECDKGEELEVANIIAGQRAKQRLAHLGVFPGTKIIKKKSAPWNGPVEIIVRGTSLVIGRGLAAKIMVICKDHCLD
jgi:ferrous iron transport protein A